MFSYSIYEVRFNTRSEVLREAKYAVSAILFDSLGYDNAANGQRLASCVGEQEMSRETSHYSGKPSGKGRV